MRVSVSFLFLLLGVGGLEGEAVVNDSLNGCLPLAVTLLVICSACSLYFLKSARLAIYRKRYAEPRNGFARRQRSSSLQKKSLCNQKLRNSWLYFFDFSDRILPQGHEKDLLNPFLPILNCKKENYQYDNR